MTTKTDVESSERRQDGIQVIARMSKIMRALGNHPQGLSLAEIALAVDLPRSTVQRIVNALEKENIVEPVGPGGGFRLGPALGQVIYQTQADIISVIRPHLESLSHQIGETICISRISGYQISLLDQVVSEQRLRVVIPLGAEAPVHITAGGKSLLATMSDEKVREWLDGEFLPRSDRDKTPEQLLAELAEVRKTGFAFDYEERIIGICAVAISVETYRGNYAIIVFAPTSRMHAQKIEEFKAALLNTKKKLEQLLGTTNTA